MSKTTLRKGKQDDKFSLAIREIQASQAANKKCFDCEQRGPTYINVTIGSFVCTKCSGMLRGINPPHRIKSISMSSFSADEVEMMRNRGNAWCQAVWLGLFDAQSQPVDFKDDEKIKEFIIAKYEKKRYYVDPSQARISRVSSASPAPEQLSTASSRSSLASGSLIGSTLKARMEPSSQVNISVSRPGAAHRPSEQPSLPARPTSNGLPVAVAQQPVNKVAAPVHTQPAQPKPLPAQQPHAAQQPKPSESFGNFADFDSAAFDSMPADPLTTTNAPLGFGGSASKEPPKPQEDKYSALAELDDLFKASAIQEPVFSDPAPSFPEPQAPVPPTGDLFQSLLETGGGGGGVFGAVDRTANGSPAAGWGRSASPRRAPAPATNSNMWGSGVGGEVGWDHGPSLAHGAQLVPQLATHSTNPFGTSPSNPPYHAPAAVETNPWTGVGTFTADMKPAHNPNNPFL